MALTAPAWAPLVSFSLLIGALLLRPHRFLKPLAAFLLVGAVLAVAPFLGLPPFYESFLYLVFPWVVLATSWNILSGYAGYFSFGHAAFFGAGVYATAVLAASSAVRSLDAAVCRVAPACWRSASGGIVPRPRPARRAVRGAHARRDLRHLHHRA